MSTVRVSNIPADAATLDAVHELFLSFGNILQLSPHGSYIDVQFQDITDAQAALDNMTGFELFGKHLQISKVTDST